MIFYRGKKILEMVDHHYDCVLESCTLFGQFMNEFLDSGITPAAEQLCQKIDAKEKEADAARRAVVNEFLSGGMLPQTRTELLRLVELNDGVANKAQDVSRQIVYECVTFPDALKPDIKKMVDLTLQQLEALSHAIELLFSNYEQLIKDNSILEEVKNFEGLVDEDELQLIRAIFAMDIHLAEKNHMKYFVSKIADISDLIEDIADAIQIMVVLRKV
ncbi:MAG: TIGR00153 family protein [Angelakisella sp.]